MQYLLSYHKEIKKRKLSLGGKATLKVVFIYEHTFLVTVAFVQFIKEDKVLSSRRRSSVVTSHGLQPAN